MKNMSNVFLKIFFCHYFSFFFQGQNNYYKVINIITPSSHFRRIVNTIIQYLP